MLGRVRVLGSREKVVGMEWAGMRDWEKLMVAGSIMSIKGEPRVCWEPSPACWTGLPGTGQRQLTELEIPRAQLGSLCQDMYMRVNRELKSCKSGQSLASVQVSWVFLIVIL